MQAKIAISIENKLLKKVDYYVKKGIYKNRSQAIQSAINETIQQLERSCLASECDKLNMQEEQDMADIGFAEDIKAWPKF